MLRLALLMLVWLFFGCENPEAPQTEVDPDPGTDDASIEPQVEFVGALPEDGDTSTAISIAVKKGNDATTSYQWAWASGEGNCNGLSQYTDVADFDTKIEISDIGDDGSKIVCVKGKRTDGTAQNTPLAHSWMKGDASEEEQNEQAKVGENLQVTAMADGLSNGATLAVTSLSFAVDKADGSTATHYRYVFDADPGDDEDTFMARCRAKAYNTDYELAAKIALSATTVGRNGKKLLCVKGVKGSEEASKVFVLWWEKSNKPTATLDIPGDKEKFFREGMAGKNAHKFSVFGSGEANKFKYVLLEGDKYQRCADVDWGGVAVTEKDLDGTVPSSSFYERAGKFTLNNISPLITKNYKTLCLLGLNDTDTQATANRYTWSYRQRHRELAPSYYSKGAHPFFSSAGKNRYRSNIQNLGDAAINYSVVLDEKSDGYDGFFAIKIANRADIDESDGWQQIDQEEDETVIEGSLAAGATRYVLMKLHNTYKTDFAEDMYEVKLLLKVDGRDDVLIRYLLYVPQLEVKSNNTVLTSTTQVTLGATSSDAHQKIRIKNVGHADSVLEWRAFAKTLRHNWFYYIFKNADNERVRRSDEKAFAEFLKLKKDEEAIVQVGMSCKGDTSMSKNNCDKSMWPQQTGESVKMRIVSNAKSPSASDEEYPYVSGGTKIIEEVESEDGHKQNKNRGTIKWRTDLYYDITYTGAIQ